MLTRFGFPIGKLFGIQVRVDVTWILLFGLIVSVLSTNIFAEFGLDRGAALMLSIATALLFFASLLAHEFGHALTARAFGIRTRQIVLFLFGGVAQIESDPRKALHEFLIAAAGPAVSVLMSGIFWGLWWFTNGIIAEPLTAALSYLGYINLALVIFNMIPGFPMDGGRILRSAIWGVTGSYLTATRVAAWFGQGFGFFLMGIGVIGMVLGWFDLGSAILYGFMGWFLAGLARQAYRQARVTDALNPYLVKDIMRPINVVVPSTLDLEDIVELYFRRVRSDVYPVVDGERLLGYISNTDAEGVEQRQWPWVQARELAKPYRIDDGIDPDMQAFAALQKIAASPIPRASIPVFKGTRLQGHILAKDLAALLAKTRIQNN